MLILVETCLRLIVRSQMNWPRPVSRLNYYTSMPSRSSILVGRFSAAAVDSVSSCSTTKPQRCMYSWRAAVLVCITCTYSCCTPTFLACATAAVIRASPIPWAQENLVWCYRVLFISIIWGQQWLDPERWRPAGLREKSYPSTRIYESNHDGLLMRSVSNWSTSISNTTWSLFLRRDLCGVRECY